jgi:hypothetical protein
MKLDILSFHQLAAALDAGSSLPELNSLLLVNQPEELRGALSVCFEVVNRVDLPEVSISAIFLAASLIHNVIRLDYRILLELDDRAIEALVNALFKSEKMKLPSSSSTPSQAIHAAVRQLCLSIAAVVIAPSVQPESVGRMLCSVGDTEGSSHYR